MSDPIWMRPEKPRKPVLVINAWTTECNACGYGKGGWMSSPALQGKPILTPESTTCHGCGVTFTESWNAYTGERKPIEAAA